MSAKLGAVAAAAPIPLLTAQVRVVEDEGEPEYFEYFELEN